MPFFAWPTYINLCVSVFAFFLTLGIALYVWNHRYIPSAGYFLGLAATLLLWVIAYFLEIIDPTISGKIIWENLQYSFFGFIPVFYFTFITVYIGKLKTIKPYLLLLICIEPILNLIIIWSGLSVLKFRQSTQIVTGGMNYPGILVNEYGNWFWINGIYNFIFFLINFIFLLVAYFQAPRWSRNRLWFLIVGLFLPWVFSLVTLPKWLSSNQDYVMVLSVAVSVVIIAWGILHNRLLDIFPIARNALLDQMSDPVAVINSEGQIVDLNQAADRYFSLRPGKWIGHSFMQLLPQPAQVRFDDKAINLQEFEITLPETTGKITFNLRISPLVDEKNNIAGWVAVFRDITDQKTEENKLREAEIRAEQSLREAQFQSRQLLTIRQTTDDLNQARSLRTALIPSLRTIQEISKTEQVWICLIDINEYSRHREIFYSSDDKNSPLKFFDDLDSHIQCLQELIDGKLVEPRLYAVKSEHEFALDIPGKAFLAFPLQTGREPLGILAFSLAEEMLPDENTLHLIETLCTSLSVAVDRVRLLKSEYEERRLAETYREINSKLTASLNLNDVLDLLLEQVTRLVHNDASGVMFVDAEKAWIARTKGYEQFSPKVAAEVSRLTFPISTTPNLSKVIQTRQPLIISDTKNAEGWKSTAISENFRSWIGAPVIINDKVRMIFSLDKKEPGFYRQQHARQLNTFCEETALAIQNAQLFEDGLKRIRELESLQATLKDISSQLDLQQLLKEIMERALLLSGSSSGALGLYEPEIQSFRIAISISAGKDLTGFIVPADEGIMNRVAQTKKPFTLDDYSSWPDKLEAFVDAFPHAILDVPLIAGDEVIGVLSIGDANRQRRYSEEDIRLVSLFAQQATIALTNARLFANAKQRADEAETLRKASSIVVSTLNQKQALHLILEQLLKVIPYDTASILLLKGDILELVEGQGFAAQENPIGLQVSLTDNQPGAFVCKQKKPLVVNDMGKDFPAFKELNNSPIRSWIGVPLIYKNRTLGILSLDSLQANRYTESQAQLVKAFADQVAIALENVWLYEGAVRSAQRFSVLYKMGQRISNSIHPEDVYHAIHKATQELMPSDSFILSLYDTDKQVIRDVYFVDHGIAQMLSSRPLGEGLFSQVITENKAVMYNSFDQKTLKKTKAVILGDEKDATLVQSLIAVPLSIGKKIMGVLSTQSYLANAFTEEDKETLELLANQSAIALENARLFSEIQEMAMTDALTQIYNRRKFFELADQEFARSLRYKHPLSVIMMDIDLFKVVNDTYGHAAGDMVLKHIAEICHGTLRSIDILARYGGEEFVVMLPETTAVEAQLSAERMRLIVARTPMIIGENAIHITLSFGVVELDSSCKNIEELLARSDQALYVSKNNGRNQVSLWTKEPKPTK
jgi:diguanylate cyclase (GGDEF)-like protein/PAS domain S-box-containing protein